MAKQVFMDAAGCEAGLGGGGSLCHVSHSGHWGHMSAMLWMRMGTMDGNKCCRWWTAQTGLLRGSLYGPQPLLWGLQWGEGLGGLWGESVCHSRPQRLHYAAFAAETRYGAGDSQEEAEETQAARSRETAEAGLETEGSETLGGTCAKRGRREVSSGSLFLGLPEGQAIPQVASFCSPLESRPTTRAGFPMAESPRSGPRDGGGVGPGDLTIPAARTQILDTSSLLQSCIQGAVGMLRDPQEGCPRGMRRVEILLQLLNEDDVEKGTGSWATHRQAPPQECLCDTPRTRPLCPSTAAFLQACKARLHALLQQGQEGNCFNTKEWVSREALNQDALQEAGTFRYRTKGIREL